MALDFPSNPSNGDTYVSGGVTFTWDGTSWVAASIITESDPVFLAHDAYNVTNAKISNWDTASSWGDHNGNYLANNHPAATVTTTKQGNWDTAFAWGDHANGGYLTNLGNALTDDDFGFNGLMKRGTQPGSYSIVTDNSDNWNTTYGWGNHANEGYLTGIGGQSLASLSNVSSSATPTDGDVLAWSAGALEWQPSTSVSFPSGTKMLFQQTAAPTGWTKDTNTNVDNRALRVVNGAVSTGGSLGFTSAFSSSRTPAGNVSITSLSCSNVAAEGSTSIGASTVSVDNATQGGSIGGTTLSVNQMPSHSHSTNSHAHSFSGTTNDPGGHTHQYSQPYQGQGVDTDSHGHDTSVVKTIQNNQTWADGAHSHTYSGTTGGESPNTNSDGGGQSHTHSFSGSSHSHTLSSHSHTTSFSGSQHTHDIGSSGVSFSGSNMNFQVQYIDVIICSKD